MAKLNIAAKITMACVLAHGLIFGLLHVLEPQLNPLSSIISDYVQTESGWIATIVFLIFAAIWLLLFFILNNKSRNWLVLTGRLFFILAFSAILVGILFPESMDPRTGTLLSKIQNLLARPGLFVGVIMVSAGLLRSPGWKTKAPILLIVSLAALLLLVLTIKILLQKELGGIGQRLIFLLLYVWVWIIANQIIKRQEMEKA